jgi:hypothetical protein
LRHGDALLPRIVQLYLLLLLLLSPGQCELRLWDLRCLRLLLLLPAGMLVLMVRCRILLQVLLACMSPCNVLLLPLLLVKLLGLRVLHLLRHICSSCRYAPGGQRHQTGRSQRHTLCKRLASCEWLRQLLLLQALH